jgi:L,D-peptidoglycan transpeptidase YkuD (ErfK/YbiS/YcfS/YnhG family)
MIVTGQGPRGTLAVGSRIFDCALGRGGIVAAAAKREGDGATPAGLWPLRRGFYRADRLALPAALKDWFQPIEADMAWDDDAASPSYNRLVRTRAENHPERLARSDGVYDIVVPLGYNDDPPQAGRGSAIFLHVARVDLAPTAGCVALALPELLAVLALCDEGSTLDIRLPATDTSAP